VKEKIQVMDTTLRDGEQMQGVSFSLEEKLSIARILLEEVKVDRIEVASARVGKKETESVKAIAEWASSQKMLERISVLGFVDFDKSVDWIEKSGVKRMNLLTKGSLRHLEKQLGKTPKQHIEDIEKTTGYAKKKGIKASIFLEDWSSGMRESKEYVMEFVSVLEKMPIERIFLTDTLGILRPEETSSFVKEMVKEFPKAEFEFHGHNDYGLAVANSLAAVKAGCKGIHTTVNGLGERAGNSALDEITAVLNDMTNFEINVDEKMLAKASKIVEAFSGKRVSANKPIAGSNVFTQTAGVHADGDKKAGLYQSKLRPERFGKQRQYALGKLSGKASLEKNLEKLGLKLSKEDKEKLLRRIVELGEMKKVVTTEDLPFIVTDLLDASKKSRICITKCKISSGLALKPSASLTLEVKGKEYSEKASGDGGYDAFMNALKKVSKKIGLEMPDLVDYQVRIPPGGKTNALVEATISWQDKKRGFCTIGVDSDQVMAAVKATEKMLNSVAIEKEK